MNPVVRRFLPWILAVVTALLAVGTVGRWRERRAQTAVARMRLADWRTRLIIEIPGEELPAWEQVTAVAAAPAVRALALEHEPPTTP